MVQLQTLAGHKSLGTSCLGHQHCHGHINATGCGSIVKRRDQNMWYKKLQLFQCIENLELWYLGACLFLKYSCPLMFSPPVKQYWNLWDGLLPDIKVTFESCTLCCSSLLVYRLHILSYITYLGLDFVLVVFLEIKTYLINWKTGILRVLVIFYFVMF